MDVISRLFSLLMILAGLCVATVILEGLPVLFVKGKKSWWCAGVICNIVTNPILNLLMFIVTAYVPNDTAVTAIMLVLEGIVVLTEAYFYHRMLNRTVLPCFVFSLAANAISFCAGISFLNI